MTDLLQGKTAGELDYIKERARQLLVRWADYQIRFGSMPKGKPEDNAEVYVEFAISKKWLSKDGTRVLSTGFKAAASMLRR